MSRNLLFDRENTEELEFLKGFLDGCVEQNLSDAEIIRRLMNSYDSSCWFAAIGSAGEIIYGN